MPRQDQQQDAVANMAQATPRNRVREEPKRKSAAPKGVCYDFYEKGVCDKQKCRFKHERPSVHRSLFGPRPQPQPPQFQQLNSLSNNSNNNNSDLKLKGQQLLFDQ